MSPCARVLDDAHRRKRGEDPTSCRSIKLGISESRDLASRQKAAVGHEKKAADLEKAIAQKQKSLASAQGSLDRAQRDQQTKNDREAEKRRKADLDHIRRLERERRATTTLPEQLAARPRLITPTAAGTTSEFTDTYDMCLSFAGEQRDYVKLIATELKRARLEVCMTRTRTSPQSSGGATSASTWTMSIANVAILSHVHLRGLRQKGMGHA